MLKIYVTRHGQDLDNSKGILNGRRNSPLTKLGQKQSQEISNKLAAIKLDAIYTSPLDRAFETAIAISKKQQNVKPSILENLIEREFGIMTGEKLKDIEKLCKPEIIKTKKYTYFLNPKGAETFPQLLTRAKKVLDYVQKKHKDGSVLLVTHGDIGKMIYAAFYGVNWQDALSSFDFGNTEVILLEKSLVPDRTKVFSSIQFNL